MDRTKDLSFFLIDLMKSVIRKEDLLNEKADELILPPFGSNPRFYEKAFIRTGIRHDRHRDRCLLGIREQ